MRKAIIYVALVFVIVACTTDKIDRKAFVQDEINKKLKQYRNDQATECYEDLLEEINIEVDSMMFYLVQKMKGNSDEMPPRPPRPGRLVDTISLEQLPKEKID